MNKLQPASSMHKRRLGTLFDRRHESQTSPKDFSGVLVKLIAFSVALGVLPLGTYYGTINKVWHGELAILIFYTLI